MASVSSNKVLFVRSHIVGLYYAGSEKLVSQLPSGTKLQLIPEPKNNFDRSAIRVEYGGLHLGYIPKSENKKLISLLQARLGIQTTLETFSPKKIDENFNVEPAKVSIILKITK